MAEQFVFQRSTKFQALRFVIVSVAFVVIATLALQYLVAADAQVKTWIQYSIYGFACALWVFFVIPNLVKKGNFRVEVDGDSLRCSFPEGRQWAVKLSQIKRVEKRSRAAMSATHVEYWVVDNEGQSYWLCPNYGLSPHSVLKALKRYLPELEVVTTTSY